MTRWPPPCAVLNAALCREGCRYVVRTGPGGCRSSSDWSSLIHLGQRLLPPLATFQLGATRRRISAAPVAR